MKFYGRNEVIQIITLLRSVVVNWRELELTVENLYPISYIHLSNWLYPSPIGHYDQTRSTIKTILILLGNKTYFLKEFMT